MPRLAIVAAMEREVRPLIRNWKMRMVEHAGRRYRLFENREVALICGGIGAEAARRATEAVIREVSPVRVISAGYAGALDGSLAVGQVVELRTVINAKDGVRTEVGSGQGILVSAGAVAGEETKRQLAKAYGAVAVDMEAAAVAQGAEVRGIDFAVFKVISDAADFNLPAMERFVSGDGQFQSLRFAGYVAVRPWLWGTAITLARNSAKASRALCEALAGYIDRQGGAVLENETLGSEANPIKVGRESASVHTAPVVGAHTEGTRQG